MSEFQEIDPRGSGLDTDSNFRVMNPNDSDHRLNCIYDTPLDDNDLGDVQNDWGMILESYAQPPGENEVIGSCKDRTNNSIIFWVWNSLRKDEIRRYFINTGVVELILQFDLNLQRNFKICHANVLLDSLSWTDGYQSTSNEIIYNSPREISISKAKGFTDGLAWPLGYTSIDLQVLEAVMYPPLYPPSQSFVSVPDLQSLMTGEYPQFFTRYVYYNYGKSIFSPFSPLNISQNEDADGGYDFAVDNAIDVTFETGHFTVIKLEICAKINNAYYLIDVLDKYDSSGSVLIPSNSTHTYRYFGGRQLGVLDEKEVLKTQEYLPQVAATQEIVQKNTVIYGNYIEGLASPETNLTVSVKMKKGTNTAPAFNLVDPGQLLKYRALSLKRLGIYQVGVVYKKTHGYHCPASSRKEARTQIPWWADPNTFNTYFDIADEWILSLNQKPYLEWNLSSTPPIWADAYEIVCTKDLRDLEKTITFVQWGAAVCSEEGISNEKNTNITIPSTAGYSFEDGDRIRLVAAYNEITTLGLAPALTAPLSFGAGFYPQNVFETYNNTNNIVYDFAIQSFDQGNLRLEVSGQINELEPTVAYVWEIYNPTRKTTASLDGGENGEIYYSIGQVYPINNPGQSNRSHSVTSGNIEGIDVYHRWKKITWNPSRVKYRVNQIAIPDLAFSNSALAINNLNLVTATIFKESVSTVASPVLSNLQDANTSATVSGFKDQKYGTSLNGNWSTFNMFFGSSTPPVISNSTVINVLSGNLVGQSVQKFAESIFNSYNYITLGALDPVALAGAIHGVMNGSGEVFIEFSTRNNPHLSDPDASFDIYILCESQSISDYYISDFDSIGKGYVENSLETRRRFISNLRHGGQFFENTQVNNLFSFDGEDFNDLLVDTYNEITRLRYLGYSLVIRQKNKTSSMYIGRTEVLNADGSSNLTTTDGIFGTINSSKEDWGSYAPAADISSGDITYFFDIQSGKVIRDALNGLVPISYNKKSDGDPYKMDKFFRTLAKKVRDNAGRYEVLGVWDDFIKCYVLTVRDLKRSDTEDESMTVIFHEPSNRWKSKMSYIPEWYENFDDTTVSFKDGNLWKHYADPNNRINYYGVKYPQEWAVICNLGYSTRKVFNNIKIDSNVPWDCDITIPPTATYELGMKSELLKEEFESLEGGGFFASFHKDMNDPAFTNSTLALINGRELRGEVIRVLLTNNEKKSTSLRSVTIWVTASEQTN